MPAKVKRIHIAVDEEMFDAWTSAAQASGISLSAWIRIRCGGTAKVVAEAPVAARRAA